MNPNRIIQNIGRYVDTTLWKLPNNKDRPQLPYQGDILYPAILIIDASGSMLYDDWKPSRLKAAKKAAKAFIKRRLSIDPNALVAVVAYGDGALLVRDMTPVKQYDKLAQSIKHIQNMGGTNITAGLHIALGLTKSRSIKSQIVVQTDGQHNEGPSPKQVSDILKKSAIIDCVGIGGSPADVDEDLLKYIASSNPDGSKRYRWIGDKEGLIQHYHKLGGGISRV